MALRSLRDVHDQLLPEFNKTVSDPLLSRTRGKHDGTTLAMDTSIRDQHRTLAANVVVCQTPTTIPLDRCREVSPATASDPTQAHVGPE